MPNLSYDDARKILEEAFADAESAFLSTRVPRFANVPTSALDTIFQSNTQAYRETLVGCVLARMMDRQVDIRLPYVKQGASAFNGRTLDEKVVNPFLRAKDIPCSRGPYLGVFRRGVNFKRGTIRGLRDRTGYQAFLRLLEYIESISSNQALQEFLLVLLTRFVILREESKIELTKLHRISIRQYTTLISGLLSARSGGRMPVFLVVAMFRTIKDVFNLDWSIEFQGINVADDPSGASGDVTIRQGSDILFVAEITERPVGRSRVEATFRTKIAVHEIEDYLFFVDSGKMEEGAFEQAYRYFAQGHEVSFVDIKEWIVMSLVTAGRKGRAVFNRHLVKLLEGPDVPKTVKVAWNEQVQKLIA